MNDLLTGTRKLIAFRSAILVMTVMISLAVGLQLVHSQNPATETKEGNTRPILIVPGNTTDAGEVIFQPDTEENQNRLSNCMTTSFKKPYLNRSLAPYCEILGATS